MISRWLHNLFLSPQEKAYVSSAWTAPEAVTIQKAICIQRTNLEYSYALITGDILDLTIVVQDVYSHKIIRTETPRFEISGPMVVDSVTRFEVVDDFGVTAGIGFILGKRKE